MESTIEFNEVVENVSISFEDITDAISIEITEILEVITIEFQELGVPGEIGKSNYKIALDNGFVGTESQWLDSQKNIDGGLIF